MPFIVPSFKVDGLTSTLYFLLSKLLQIVFPSFKKKQLHMGMEVKEFQKKFECIDTVQEKYGFFFLKMINFLSYIY